MAKRIQVGGRIESQEVGGIVTGAAEILDDAKGKNQSVINGETDDELLRLDQSKQDNLTFDNAPTEGSDNPVKSGGLYTAQQAILLAIAAINELIPSAASVLNKLADKAFVNSSISTNTATFRGTSAAGLNEQQFLAWANGLEHDLNDYVFWQTSDAAGNTLFKRYKWNGTEWKYEYTLNNSTFTAEQWEAIQSGITALLVTKLRALPTAEQLIQSFDGKQDVLTFDDVPTLGSTNPVKSSGIYNVITAITDLIPAEATAQNQLADKADVAAKIVAAIPSWKGQYDALTDLQAVTGAKAGDMGCVKTTDSDGHAVLTFYQYSAQGAWVVYYTLRHYAQNKPATTGTTGDYPYNGLGRIELQKNIVNGVNTLTQAMLTQQNTIYVIQYDFTLGEDITVPGNCMLEFAGGKINGDYSINFQGLKSEFIYTSWMGVETLHKSIQYMSYKTLVVDTVLELSTPLTNRGVTPLFYFTITGVEDNNYEWAEGNNKEHSRIICSNCSAIDIYGWCNFVKNLSFTFSSGGNDNPFIILDTQGAEISDLDSGVYNCFFDTDDKTNPQTFNDININNAIVTYGRGLVTQGCMFNGAVKDSYVKCLMKRDNWRPSPGIEVSDKYGGRAFWIHHNRLHMGIARLVHFAVNESAPDCIFRGIRIENNIADIGGSLGLFDAKSYNTVITNNTFLGGVHGSLPFLTFTDGNEIEINNNVFRGYDNEDLPSGLSNEYLISIKSSGDEIKSISICDNIASPRGYFIITDCNIDGINICDNIMSEQAFTASNIALLRALKTTKNAVVKNNINNSSNNTVPAFRAWDNSYPNEGVDNISIADNLGFLNWIASFGQYTSLLNGRSYTNVNIKYDKGESPDTIMDACSYAVNVKSKIGFSYINTVLYPIRLAIWSGSKWIERDSASLGVVRSGSFASKPVGSDIYVGFKYFCTDKQTTEGATNGIEIIYKGNDVWVDALGRVVS